MNSSIWRVAAGQGTGLRGVRRLLPVLACLALVGCGGGSKATESGSLVGKYTIDLGRTLGSPAGAPSAGAGGLPVTPPPAGTEIPAGSGTEPTPPADASFADMLGPDAYALDLRADGTFTLTVKVAGGETVLAGLWTRDADGGVRVVTGTIDGEVAPSDVPAETVLTSDSSGAGLVITEGDTRIFLQRR